MVDWQNPSVAQQLLFSTVRIETLDPNNAPLAVGTSFALAHDFPAHPQQVFLVSNKHVAEGTATGLVYFTSEAPGGGPKIGEPFFVRIDQFAFQWHGHPEPDVDVAVYPLSWQLDLIRKGRTSSISHEVVHLHDRL